MIKITKRVANSSGRSFNNELVFNDFDSLFNWIIQWGKCPDVKGVTLYDKGRGIEHLFEFTLNAETVTVLMVTDMVTGGIYFSNGDFTRGQTHMSETLLPYIEKARKELAKPIYNFI